MTMLTGSRIIDIIEQRDIGEAIMGNIESKE